MTVRARSRRGGREAEHGTRIKCKMAPCWAVHALIDVKEPANGPGLGWGRGTMPSRNLYGTVVRYVAGRVPVSAGDG